jgi:hypothetical protein
MDYNPMFSPDNS